MGEDFVIRLEGENSITVSSDNYYEIIRGDYLNFEGAGSPDLLDVPMLGISYSYGLTIDGCTINITGNQSADKNSEIS